MNPVDHVSRPYSDEPFGQALTQVLFSPTVVVIINILVKLLRSQDMRRKDRKLVSSQRGGQVFLGVHKRRRIRIEGKRFDMWFCQIIRSLSSSMRIAINAKSQDMKGASLL